MTGLVEKKIAENKNDQLTYHVLQQLQLAGVRDICMCPGGRNTPFVEALEGTEIFNVFYWPEERSAAFFALGRSKLTHLPTAVITTSGTAVGELLPAAMEAYYAGIPLLLLTADRPRRFRGSGAPQTAEQVGLFGQYAVFEQDLEADEICNLTDWKKIGVAHLNVCLEEPVASIFSHKKRMDEDRPRSFIEENTDDTLMMDALDTFLEESRYPFVIVGAIPENSRENIIHFLMEYGAPVYLEAISGLREEGRLKDIRILCADHIRRMSAQAGYPLDGVLRIGGVPTFRFWRDLENLQGRLKVCSISHLPFSGLSWGSVCQVNLQKFFTHYLVKKNSSNDSKDWLKIDQNSHQSLLTLLQQEPSSEAACVHQLSKIIPPESLIYLGNSLPIREWDAFASYEIYHPHVFASRGLNGIDGQLSTFFGMCTQKFPNWGIVGDLTTLYDLAAPWILEQLSHVDINLVVINNGGGKIFERMFPNKKIQNRHQIQFKSLAELWNMRYVYYTQLPEDIPYGGHRLIEIRPDEESTTRFWNRLVNI
ncbi:MAG: 2-succinyl-5-enolpyruvyl-6-hydroxy-3-cyclohexene-1-carboxylic-acid synthase [Chlamydiales bacterium 38-26]|nr:2-succinyl-5-enolpyruvyl-6-hydroxy-3-cyclohexene-1-carboxylic-acid synthase [Chlamydiales bacterium]OJV09430.1 MAG: 2-succinyl-5-enolpyruvyl-6-hydroxy-3-cyclohexene-1-carboxylic-acid synthase [Chlamydiales bacterium 38-26]